APGTALWLAPTRRAVEAVRRSLLGEASALFGLRLATFSDLITALVEAGSAPATALSDVQRRLLLEDLVADLQQRGELPPFAAAPDTRGFLAPMPGLASELQRAGISPVRSARATDEIGEGRPTSAQEYQCARIYSRYRRELDLQQLHDSEARQARARDLLAQGERGPFRDVRALFVDGFTDFTHGEHDLLDALRQGLDELWIALPDEEG